MERLMTYWHQLRRVALVTALAAVGATMLGSGASSAWANSTFNCESRSESKKIPCFTISGPNEGMEEGEGDNYTYPEFELIFYRFNGGSSYTQLYSKIFYSYTGYHCYSSLFDGHLQVASVVPGNLAGNQKKGCIA